ncbi:hypothetical protein [Chloroflexus sp.]|uniref:hypothetical protein n=1 Tax=Chloroflexus sp. TaxID=1904827 RepID=UPI002ADD7C22|nr:hypothetical protein [Chloroflexus sp.]
MDDQKEGVVQAGRRAALHLALQRIVLLRETGPKSAAWQRARMRTMWRLQQQLAADDEAATQSTRIEDDH